MADPDERQRLDDEEIEFLVSRLKEGQYLPDYLRNRLFRIPREYELSYLDKQPKSEILSETMAVPLQTVKRLGKPSQDSLFATESAALCGC